MITFDIRLLLDKRHECKYFDEDEKQWYDAKVKECVWFKSTQMEYLTIVYRDEAGENERYVTRFDNNLQGVQDKVGAYLQTNSKMKLVRRSRVRIFSRTREEWCSGYISQITMINEKEWLTVKYKHNKKRYKKKIQRFCLDLQTPKMILY